MEIVPGVHGIGCNGRVWAYLVRSGNRWTLIDAGFPADLSLIEAELASLNARISHIGQIVLLTTSARWLRSSAELR